MSEYDLIFKVLLIGNASVGKTSLMMRFADDMFNEAHRPTIGVDFKIKTIEAEGKTVKLQVWDTAGQDRFKTITTSYYRGAHGVAVVYDITDRDSFQKVSEWLSDVDEHCGENTQRILIGNKNDLETERDVLFKEGEELADQYNMKFVETSAKTADNVEQAFLLMSIEMKNICQ